MTRTGMSISKGLGYVHMNANIGATNSQSRDLRE